MVDDDQFYPLDEKNINSISDEELIAAFDNGSAIWELGDNKIVRVARNFVIKGGLSVLPSEAKNMEFASKVLDINVPKVHRIFNIKEKNGIWGTTCYILMDCISGTCLTDSWPKLSKASQTSILTEVAKAINQMQSVVLRKPGPIGGTTNRWMGTWFSDYGAGPFESTDELENWLNHALQISKQWKRVIPGTPDFKIKKLVFSHLDIAPRNLMIDDTGKLWLIDWAFAGAFPVGFEQAVVHCQMQFPEFKAGLLSKVSESTSEKNQLKSILCSLPTAATPYFLN